MAKLDRKDVKIFAENSNETLITEFRTETQDGQSASFSRDPDVIQNENYSQGWVDNTNNLNTKIYGEDLNAVNYVLSYLLKYIYENGIAEWNSTTTYYENSIVKSGSDLYISLEDDNIGNDPTNTVSYWKLIPTDTITAQDAGVGYSIVKALSGNDITFKTLSVTGYGTLTDNGDQLNINIAGGGGGGGGDAFWGMIQGTLSNQTDLVNALDAKQNTITCSSPLTLDSNNNISIPKATTAVSGYLDYNDFNTFNGKQNSLSFSTPLSETSGTVSISKADTSTSGYLDYNDWNTFNGKQNAIQDVSFTSNTTQVFQEPNTSKTSFMGTDSRPYDYAYIDQIGDSLTPTTNIYSTNLISTNITTTNISSDNYDSKANYSGLGTDITNFNFGTTIDFSIVQTREIPILNIISKRSSDDTMSEILPTLTVSPERGAHYCSLGSSSQRFVAGYFFNLNASSNVTTPTLYVDIIRTTDNDVITLANNIVPSSNDTICLGTDNSHRFSQLWIQHIHVREDIIPEVNPSQVAIGSSGAKFGDIWCTRINGSNYNPSDRDKKENINTRINGAKGKKTSLDIISNIETYTYNYKDDEDKTIHIGIMAQDLAQEVPECVIDKGKENTKGEHEKDLYIDVMGYVTVLTEALKELNEKVKFLEARVEELEGNKKELEK